MINVTTTTQKPPPDSELYQAYTENAEQYRAACGYGAGDVVKMRVSRLNGATFQPIVIPVRVEWVACIDYMIETAQSLRGGTSVYTVACEPHYFLHVIDDATGMKVKIPTEPVIKDEVTE